MGITVVIGSFRLNAVVCLFTLAITGSYADGAERFVDSPILGSDSPGPYCGLYSAARLASLLPDERKRPS
jgi:TctA family transporter